MSKKPPKGNIIPFANKNKKDDMMDILSSMAYEDIELQTSDYFAEQIVNILPKVMSTAIDMTKLVIENRVRNAEKRVFPNKCVNFSKGLDSIFKFY